MLPAKYINETALVTLGQCENIAEATVNKVDEDDGIEQTQYTAKEHWSKKGGKLLKPNKVKRIKEGGYYQVPSQSLQTLSEITTNELSLSYANSSVLSGITQFRVIASQSIPPSIATTSAAAANPAKPAKRAYVKCINK